MAKRMLEQNRALYICFVYYEKAFDRVGWEKIFQMLKLRQFPKRIVNLIGSLYSNQKKTVISINGVLSEDVQIRNGVLQCCILTPSLLMHIMKI